MKILVTGSNGQLGNEIRELASEYPNYRFLFTDVAELDITDEATVNAFIAADKPDVIINCAAYTAVDKAETQEDMAFLINAKAAAILAKAAKKHYAFLVHVSTDYVFDGRGHLPLSETDATNPLSVYAKSKFQGEEEIKQHASKAMIIRTSWLYSPFGGNFIKTILKYGAERDSLRVVFDQVGSPTYARDLAHAILENLQEAAQDNGTNIYHFSDEGVTSWYDLAIAILEMSTIKCKVEAIVTAEYPLPAVRPYYSVLNKEKFKKKFTYTIPHWRSSLAECLKRMGY
ncbi:MAG: dTDP-4-dehydrorhamnose reductase [Bacteroidales bacterium]|nr:dTDP-4-dehydrorhamnose reductase [Bacteroidales bacterium]